MVASDSADYADQKAHFDLTRNQYARARIIEPPVHTAVELDVVLRRLGDIPCDGPVIDFGAGTGRLSIALARAGYPVLAVDISESSLSSLTRLASDLHLTDIACATALPDGGLYHAIVGADVLHHVDLDDVLPRLRGLLTEGGKVLFSEPGGMHPFWYLYLPIVADMRVERRIVTCNPRTLRRAFARWGFRDIRITGVGVLPRSLTAWSERACRINDRIGGFPGVRRVAYRYLIEASA
jgi:2-polyprenyl-3-methyl-5-hydroxy-6-metoxy-1,4-benzoquinol methylase